MTKITQNGTKEAVATAVIPDAEPIPALPLDYLKQERTRMRQAHRQLLDNANAHAGIIQWLDMQIERLESEDYK